MIPSTLNEWTFDIIKELVQKKISESDRHDFKKEIPSSETLTKRLNGKFGVLKD